MKPDCDSERLLDDVFADAAPEEYRAQLWTQTLQQVRRQRRLRTLGKGTVATVLVLLAMTWLWNGWTGSTARSGRTLMSNAARRPERRTSSCQLVQSHPLDPARLVRTQPGLTPIISSASSQVLLVETRHDRHLYSEIDDEQLLALLAGRSAALIREGPDQAELLLPKNETVR